MEDENWLKKKENWLENKDSFWNDSDNWWDNMKKLRDHNADITNVETKRIHVEAILGRSLSRLVAEYCEMYTCLNIECNKATLWGVCSMDCGLVVGWTGP